MVPYFTINSPMAKNVLIDTCVLKELISKIEFNGYLRQIVSWQQAGHILIHCPKTLKNEWEVHRKKELKGIQDSLKNHQQSLKASKLFSVVPDIGDAQLEAADKLLQAQVEAVDELLAGGRQVNDELGAAKSWTHKDRKLAPFRVKSESDKDAIIIFSTLEDIKSRGESELYFFSSNYTDYAAVGNSDVLHHDITSSYPEVNITYYVKLSQGIDNLIRAGLPSAKTTLIRKNQVKELIAIDRKKSMIDQAFDYLHKRFNDINFLPKKLYLQHYPFVATGTDLDRYLPFTLNTDNKELYDLIINYDRNGTALLHNKGEAEDKLGDIIRFLRGNYVHSIAFKAGRSVEMPSLGGKSCDCALCIFRTNDLATSLKKISEIVVDDNHSLKDAYIFFIHGQMTKAVEILRLAAAKAEQDKKWLSLYIATYNLVLIGRLMRFETSPGDEDHNFYEKLRQISLDEVYLKCRADSIDLILDHLNESKFMNEAIDKIKVIVAKIKDDQIDRNTGWNDQTRLLLDHYFETVSTVEQNFIMVEEFSEIQALTGYFVDGLFASYASRKELGGKLLNFTSPIVEKIVTYANNDNIKTFRNRYNLKIVEYEAEHGPRNFVEQLCALMQSYSSVVKHYNDDGNEGGRTLWPKYRRMFMNGLTMASILKISKEDVSQITRHLLPFLKDQKHFNEYELTRVLAYFIRNNADLLEVDELEQFLLFTYTSDAINREELAVTLSNISRSKPLVLRLTLQQWQALQSHYLVNEELKKDGHSLNEICCLHDFLHRKAYKNEIAKFLLHFLKNNFDPEVYYWAVIHNMVKPTRNTARKYEQAIIQLADKGRQPRFFEPRTFYIDHRIDEYLNLAFRDSTPLSSKFIQSVTKLDEYYRWVTDMDNYDYTLFDPDWLFVHLTMYYKDKFRQSIKLREQLRKLALRSPNFKLGQLFIDVFTDSL
jgi:hypothetical protein